MAKKRSDHSVVTKGTFRSFESASVFVATIPTTILCLRLFAESNRFDGFARIAATLRSRAIEADKLVAPLFDRLSGLYSVSDELIHFGTKVYGSWHQMCQALALNFRIELLHAVDEKRWATFSASPGMSIGDINTAELKKNWGEVKSFCRDFSMELDGRDGELVSRVQRERLALMEKMAQQEGDRNHRNSVTVSDSRGDSSQKKSREVSEAVESQVISCGSEYTREAMRRMRIGERPEKVVRFRKDYFELHHLKDKLGITLETFLRSCCAYKDLFQPSRQSSNTS
jgi:hypothetical protein